MSTAAVQPPSPGWKFGFLWLLATGGGALLGPFLAFPLNLALVVFFGVTAPLPGTPTLQAVTLTVDGMGASMLSIGLGMGFCQWLLLRRYLKHSAGWIVATGVAMLLAGLYRGILPADIDRELIGPLTIPAGAILLAVCQWFALRGRVPHAGWWVVFCIGGWVPTLAASVVFGYLGLNVETLLAFIVILIGTILPFVVAAAGMVWLLRQTTLPNQAAA